MTDAEFRGKIERRLIETGVNLPHPAKEHARRFCFHLDNIDLLCDFEEGYIARLHIKDGEEGISGIYRIFQGYVQLHQNETSPLLPHYRLDGWLHLFFSSQSAPGVVKVDGVLFDRSYRRP